MRMRYALLSILCAVPLAHANDFPTRARVEFVLTCMRESKAPQQESMYKCSCAIDAIADKIHYCEWAFDCGRRGRGHARYEGRAQDNRVVSRTAGKRQEALLHQQRVALR